MLQVLIAGEVETVISVLPLWSFAGKIPSLNHSLLNPAMEGFSS
jgi:hypothetical protein